MEIVGGANRTTVDGREVSDKDDKLENILKAAGFTDENNGTKIKADASGKRPDGFLIVKPDGTSDYIAVDPNDGSYTGSSGTIPKGSTITSKKPTDPNNKIITFTFNYGTDDEGNPYKKTVPVEVASGDTASWQDIQSAATANGINLFPAGYTLQKLNNSTSFNNDTPLTASSTPINIVFAKNVLFTIVYGPESSTIGSKDVTLEIIYPKGKTLKEIFDAAQVDTNATASPAAGWKAVEVPETRVFEGWTVTGKSELVKPSVIDNNKRPDNTKLPTFRDRVVITAKLVTPRSISLGDGASIGFTEIKSIEVGDFYIQNTEITRAQWKAVMLKEGNQVTDSDGWHVKDGHTLWAETLTTGTSATAMNLPMTYISWYDAVMFCNMLSIKEGRRPCYFYIEGKKGTDSKDIPTDGIRITDPDIWIEKNVYGNLTSGEGHNQTEPGIWGRIYYDNTANGYKLPTEKEWVVAAQGGYAYGPYPKYSGTTGTSNTDLDKIAWTDRNSNGKVHPVGEKGGDYPVRDMTGNVWEWTMEEYANYRYLYKGGPYNADNFTLNSFDGHSTTIQSIDYVAGGGCTGNRSPGIGFRIMEYKKRN